MLQVSRFTFNAFQENTYILFDDSKEAVIIDPGCYDREEQMELVDFIDHHQLTVKLLINTHGHVDHVLGNNFIKQTYGVKLLIHAKDEPVLKSVKVYAPVYGMTNYDEATIDGYLEEGGNVTFGNQKLEILFVPGHSPGHVAFYCRESRILIGGDVLFRNSIGRTDLPGGNFDTLINSIHQKLFTLPDNVIVYPGHGPETSIGFEKKTNPFCAISIS